MARPSKSFKGASAPARPRFDLKAAVAEVYADHPELKGSVLFLDVAKTKLVHSDEDVRKQLLSIINNDDATRTDVNTQMYHYRLDKASAVQELSRDGHTVYFAYMYLRADMESALGKGHDLSENKFLVFDHEFAHAFIKEAHGATLKSETVADAYAALRHFQRFGSESKTIEKLMKRRAALGFLNQDDGHFSPPVLQAAIDYVRDNDVTKLNPQQTVDLAIKLSKDSGAKPRQIKVLSKEFNKYAKPMKYAADDKPLRKLAKAASSSPSPLVRKWARVAVAAFTDTQMRMGHEGCVRATGEYWKQFRKQSGQPHV